MNDDEEEESRSGRCSSEDDISVMTPLLPPPPPLKNGYVSQYHMSGSKKGGQEDGSDVKSLGNSTISSTAEHLSRRSLSSSRRGVLDMDQNSVASGMVMDHVSSASSKVNPLKRMNRALANDDYSALNQEMEEAILISSSSDSGDPVKVTMVGDNGSLGSGEICAKDTEVGGDEDKISNEEIGRLVYSTGPTDVDVVSVEMEEQDVEDSSAESEEPSVEQSVSGDGERVTGTRVHQGGRLMVSDVELSDYVSDAVQSILRLSSSDEDSMSDSNASSVVTGVNDSGSNASPPQRLNKKVSHSMEKLDVELEMLRKSYKAAPRRSGRSAYSRHMASDDEIDQIFDSIKKSFKKEARKVKSSSGSNSQSAGQDSGEEVKLRRRISEKETKTLTRWRSNENTRLSSVDI